MIAYDILIVAAGIFKKVLDFESWIKFLNSHYISQTTSKFQTQYWVAKSEYNKSFMRDRKR